MLRWWVASQWWLLAIDDIGNLLLVAPAKADGGDGGPGGVAGGMGGRSVRWFELLEVLFILGS